MPKKLTQDEYITKASKVHNDFYNYSKVVYTKSHDKIKIICPIHGEFSQKACNHINGKQGCPSCAGNKPYSSEEFVEKATTIHNGFYSYDNLDYNKAHEKVVITCPVHGDFSQLPYVHLQGHHCPNCGNESTKLKNQNKDNTWSYTGWEQAGNSSTEFVDFSLYVIRCWDDKESFIKVGKTFTTISRRFRGNLPYNWELLEQKIGSAKYISCLEHELHTFLKDYSIVPVKKFNGSFECYTETSQEYINEFFNSRTTSSM